MGQQQLLLIALAVIVVGVAIAISIQLFRQNAIDRKREILINESAHLATIAIGYYKRPVQFGGGGKKFTGWAIPSMMVQTDNGTYSVDIYQDSCVIDGVGTEVVTGKDSIEVRTTVLANSYKSVIIR